MVAHQASMKGNLFKAEEAMQHKDAVRAKKYADLTERCGCPGAFPGTLRQLIVSAFQKNLVILSEAASPLRMTADGESFSMTG